MSCGHSSISLLCDPVRCVGTAIVHLTSWSRLIWDLGPTLVFHVKISKMRKVSCSPQSTTQLLQRHTEEESDHGKLSKILEERQGWKWKKNQNRSFPPWINVKNHLLLRRIATSRSKKRRPSKNASPYEHHQATPRSATTAAPLLRPPICMPASPSLHCSVSPIWASR